MSDKVQLYKCQVCRATQAEEPGTDQRRRTFFKSIRRTPSEPERAVLRRGFVCDECWYNCKPGQHAPGCMRRHGLEPNAGEMQVLVGPPLPPIAVDDLHGAYKFKGVHLNVLASVSRDGAGTSPRRVVEQIENKQKTARKTYLETKMAVLEYNSRDLDGVWSDFAEKRAEAKEEGRRWAPSKAAVLAKWRERNRMPSEEAVLAEQRRIAERRRDAAKPGKTIIGKGGVLYKKGKPTNWVIVTEE